jgi:hypothetical protein
VLEGFSFLAIAISCFFISYHDLKYREVWWGWFLFLLLGVILHKYEALGLETLFTFLLYNLLILFVQLGGVQVYFWLKKGKGSIINTQIGFGDIVLLLVLTVVFTPDMYLVFFNAGALIAIAIYLVMSSYKVKYTIPLAGILSILLLVVYSVANYYCDIKGCFYYWTLSDILS